MKILICKQCGNPYDAHMYNANGKIYGVKTSYCSDICRVLSNRKSSNRSKKIRRAALAEVYGSKHNGKNGGELYRACGPTGHNQCFFCPMLGWKCRNQKIPLCSTISVHHEEYLLAVQGMEQAA